MRTRGTVIGGAAWRRAGRGARGGGGAAAGGGPAGGGPAGGGGGGGGGRGGGGRGGGGRGGGGAGGGGRGGGGPGGGGPGRRAGRSPPRPRATRGLPPPPQRSGPHHGQGPRAVGNRRHGRVERHR